MELIDDEGNLFESVNVIDALAVLLLLAVLLVGLAFVGTFTEPTEETRYVTLDLGEHPEYVADQVEAGDVMAREGTVGNLTITDVYVTPTENETVALTIRVEVEGTLIDGSQRGGSNFEFAGTTLRPGASLTVETSDYELDGTVVSMADEGESLDTDERAVTLRTTVPSGTARQLDEGDTFEVAGHSVATLETVTVYPTDDPDTRRTLLEVRLQTIDRSGTVQFGAKEVKLDTPIPFETDAYDLMGTVVAHEDLPEVGDTETVTATVKLENISPEQADVIDVGMGERIDGTTTAVVVDKRVEPAVVILTSDDGDIYQREHPRNEDVYLTVELEVNDTDDGLYFHGERLRYGDEVVLDFRTVTVHGTVVDVEE